MTDQEREQVLKMIENGKISPEDGLKLMRTLDQTPAEDEVIAVAANVDAGTEPERTAEKNEPKAQFERSSFEADPRIEKIKSTVRRLWQIPLWIGVLITILSAWGMYALVQAGHLNFWFFCLMRTASAGRAGDRGCDRKPQGSLDLRRCAPETR